MSNLESYIKENLRRGVKLESIKKALYASKYKKEVVELAVKKIYKEQIIDIAKYINKEIRQGLHPSSVKNYLVALGHPKAQVDDAIEKIINAKKALLRKKKLEKVREQFKAIKDNIFGKFSKYMWYELKPWQRGAYIPSVIMFILLLVWEISMIFNSIILSGSLNCYSFGRIITCSLFESLLFYVLLMLAFIVIFCLPIFGLGALVGYFIGRFRE